MQLTKKNITKVLIDIQNRGDLIANHIATKAIEDFRLEREHQRQTKNPKKN